jgi:predicted signal transduction protein with EAL and GGDEF domain
VRGTSPGEAGEDPLALYRDRIMYALSPPIPMILLLLPMTVATGISLKVQGFFSSLVYYYIGLAYTIRFFMTLTLTIILANIVLSIIGDLHRRLMDQAIVDPLTGAFNRRHMQRCVDDAIERQRRSSASASVLLIDIDHFKRINDQLGHAKGDSVLKAMVSLIRKRARKLDLLFRIGGEEFMRAADYSIPAAAKLAFAAGVPR